MAKKRIPLEVYNKMTEEERRQAFFEQQGEVRPLGEPWLNAGGGISIRLIEQKAGAKRKPASGPDTRKESEKGWLTLVHLPLHKALATALLQPGVWDDIEACIRKNWQWLGVKEEDCPPGWKPAISSSQKEEPEEPREEDQEEVEHLSPPPPKHKSLAEQRAERQRQQELELKKKQG